MKYSVIVPVYQCERDLTACVGSVLAQTESDWELLLVDDGSTDGSGELCDRLAAEDERIRVFHQANKGASGARNTGLEHARGNYILFLDGDDTVEEELLERLSAILAPGDVQMVIFGMSFDYYDLNDKLIKSEAKSIRHRETAARQEFLDDYSDYFSDNALSSACNKAISAELLRENRIRFSEQMILYEDLDFVLKALPYCNRIAFLDRTSYHYRIRKEQDHFAHRVKDITKLHCNLAELADTALQLHSDTVSRVTANLIAQLYDRFLLLIPKTKKEAEEARRSILSSPVVERLRGEGMLPEEDSSTFWPLLAEERSDELWPAIVKRRAVRRVKRSAKQVLWLLGLKR